MSNKEVKVGRPSKYEPWMCDKIIEVAGEGGHIPAMCAAIGIRSEDTFHRWKKEHKEFADAYEEARTISQGVYESLLLQGALGKIKNFNFNAIAMIMNNKFPNDYKRGTGSGSNTEVTINQLNMTPEQVSAKINQKLERLKSMGIELLDHDRTEDE